MGSQIVISAIVPVYNKRDYVRDSLESIVRAAQAHGRVEVIAVDHGSTDGSLAVIRAFVPLVRLLHVRGGTISAVRNAGARLSTAPVLAFLDCDCVVDPSYFTAVEDAFRDDAIDALGSEVDVPADASRITTIWTDLVRAEHEGDTHYLNAANFCLRRAAFDRVGGFNELLITGEDSDLCKRLRRAGSRIRATERVRAVHLDNPGSARAFYGKEVWRGLSAFHPSTLRDGISPATLMVVLHAALALLALWLIIAVSWPWWLRLLTTAALLLAVPAITVLHRIRRTRRIRSALPGIAVYTLYYAARVHAMAIAAIRAIRPREGPAASHPATISEEPVEIRAPAPDPQ